MKMRSLRLTALRRLLPRPSQSRYFAGDSTTTFSTAEVNDAARSTEPYSAHLAKEQAIANQEGDAFDDEMIAAYTGGNTELASLYRATARHGTVTTGASGEGAARRALGAAPLAAPSQRRRFTTSAQARAAVYGHKWRAEVSAASSVPPLSDRHAGAEQLAPSGEEAAGQIGEAHAHHPHHGDATLSLRHIRAGGTAEGDYVALWPWPEDAGAEAVPLQAEAGVAGLPPAAAEWEDVPPGHGLAGAPPPESVPVDLGAGSGGAVAYRLSHPRAASHAEDAHGVNATDPETGIPSAFGSVSGGTGTTAGHAFVGGGDVSEARSHHPESSAVTETTTGAAGAASLSAPEAANDIDDWEPPHTNLRRSSPASGNLDEDVDATAGVGALPLFGSHGSLTAPPPHRSPGAPHLGGTGDELRRSIFYRSTAAEGRRLARFAAAATSSSSPSTGGGSGGTGGSGTTRGQDSERLWADLLWEGYTPERYIAGAAAGSNVTARSAAGGATAASSSSAAASPHLTAEDAPPYALNYGAGADPAAVEEGAAAPPVGAVGAPSAEWATPDADFPAAATATGVRAETTGASGGYNAADINAGASAGAVTSDVDYSGEGGQGLRSAHLESSADHGAQVPLVPLQTAAAAVDSLPHEAAGGGDTLAGARSVQIKHLPGGPRRAFSSAAAAAGGPTTGQNDDEMTLYLKGALSAASAGAIPSHAEEVAAATSTDEWGQEIADGEAAARAASTGASAMADAVDGRPALDAAPELSTSSDFERGAAPALFDDGSFGESVGTGLPEYDMGMSAGDEAPPGGVAV